MNRTLLLAALAGLVLAGGYFVYEIIDTDAPDAVTTSAALEQLQADTAAEDTEATAQAGEGAAAEADQTAEDADASAPIDVAAGVQGTWVVDDEFGEFGFDSASGSFAGFRVEKSFFSGQEATAVGRTGGVTGEVAIADGALSSAQITVDMTQMVSDDSAREGAINDAIKVNDHPTGTFTVTTPVALDTGALENGETVAVDVAGELTVAGVTNQVTVPIEATIVEGGLGLIIGSTDLVWADYGVETPQSRVADVADNGVLEFQLIVRLA